MGQHLDQKKFHAINRAIKQAVKDGKYNTERLAKVLGVSRGTINRVRQARSWNGFLALKASRQTSPKVSKTEKELATNVEALEAEDNRFAEELKRLEKTPTRIEMKEAIEEVHSRQDLIYAPYRALARNWMFRFLFGHTVRVAVDKFIEEESKRQVARYKAVNATAQPTSVKGVENK